MMRNSHFREFSVLAFDAASVRGCQFRRRGAQYAVERSVVESIEAHDPAEAWRRVLRRLGRGRECPLFLTGALAGGIFFRFLSIDLPPRARREALELELPQRMLTVPDNCRFQFFAGETDAEGNVPVNVYVIPGSALEHPAAMLTQAGGRADEFLYPLLAVRAGDPPADLPRTDPDFGFEDGEWRPSPPEPDFRPWLTIFSSEFKLPADGGFRVGDFFECLLAARLVVSPSFGQQERALRLLPAELRSRRYRNQLRITALLVLLIAGNYLWSAAGSYRQNYQTFSRLAGERDRIKAENSSLTAKLRSFEKEQRELNRVVSLAAGEPDVLPKLAALTSILPSNVMVSSLRWSESSVDLMLQSEADNLDLPSLFRRIPYWKIGQLQQRRMGDTVTMITLKLVPAGEASK